MPPHARPQLLQLAGLTARVVGPADATLTAVLMHGFGAPGDDLVPLADELDTGAARVRYVFPEAPLSLGGLYGDARAWWPLDLEKLEAQLAAGGGDARDLRAAIPDGLAAARAGALALLDEVDARFGGPGHRAVVGGFSQGAMLALDAALHREAPPAGLLLLSGTLLAEAVWQPRLARLAGVPVLMTHGRADGLLPFSAAELLRDRLAAAGAAVEWHAFAGAHEIPPVALAAAGAFLRRVGGA